MKNVTPEININNIKDTYEKVTESDIDISEFDSTLAYLESKDDLTEKVINYIEREIRGSYEYRGYISYLKNELDLTKCALLPGIDCKDGAASLEFHHYPLNLYEITEIIGKQLIDSLGENDSISCFDIAEKVMEEHYKGNVGLVPLTKTLHDMAHNRSIIIPISKVNGNYKTFLKKYNTYIDSDIKDRIQEAELSSDSDDAKIFNQSKLEKNISKFNITYYGEDDNEEEL